MNTEFLDIYDENRKWRGFARPRSESYRPGEYHLIVHVCLMNEQNEMLIQQRADSVARWAGMWDLTIGGHVLAGEQPVEAAVREMREELGLEVSFVGARIISRKMERRFDDTFVVFVTNVIGYDGSADGLLRNLVLQEEEVQAVKWASRQEIENMIENGKFIGYSPELVGQVFG